MRQRRFRGYLQNFKVPVIEQAMAILRMALLGEIEDFTEI